MNLRRWFGEHSLKLLAIRDTPEAIAGGVAIGIFFGFTPLFGFKTVLAILLAWLTRSNILAAVIAGTLHDLVLPFMPVIYIWEYKMGYWIINQEWPKGHFKTLPFRDLWHWKTFLTIGKPVLFGSIIYGAPAAVAAYFITKSTILRHRLKKARAAIAAAPGGDPLERDPGPQV